jgi:hypothetical protein
MLFRFVCCYYVHATVSHAPSKGSRLNAFVEPLSWIAEGPKTKFVQATSLLPNTTYHRPPPATTMSQ